MDSNNTPLFYAHKDTIQTLLNKEFNIQNREQRMSRQA